jgi:GH15 family glucan-1,4-alpha-glucosidase
MHPHELSDISRRLILRTQHPSGAYVASPTYVNYSLCWLRDGSFIAHAMSVVGEIESAVRFHRWVASVLARYADKLEGLLARRAAGEHIALSDQMHARYTLEGSEEHADWGNFQLDGYGTWLWAVVEHAQRSGDDALLTELRPHLDRVARYLQAFWQTPCFDYWEEHGDAIHPSTLAALYGGLNTYATYTNEPVFENVANTIKTFVEEHAVVDGHLLKSIGNNIVDASLLGLATPFHIFPVNDVRVENTVRRIETDLGYPGVHRYVGDTYYGGGAWLLLSAWLGWHYADKGDLARAIEQRDWVLAHAEPDGSLPEQVAEDLLAPDAYQHWVDQHGPSASPLVWSHAMYLILEHAIRTSSEGTGA